MSAYLLCKNRLTHGGEASKLALVTIVTKTECTGRSCIRLSKAVDRGNTRQPFIAAVYFLDLTVNKPATAMVDVVTAAVGGDHQSIVPVGIEQRRYRVRFVVIVEIDDGVVAEAAITRKRIGVEEIGVAYCVSAPCFSRDEARLFSLNIGAKVLTDPPIAAKMVEVLNGEVRTSES